MISESIRPLHSEKTFALVRSCNNAKQLTVWMKEARLRGEVELEKAAFRKLVSTMSSGQPGTVEHDFWQAIHATEYMLTETRGRIIFLERSRRKAARISIMQALIDWALFPMGQETEGFRMLLDWKIPELTAEAIVLGHRNNFDQYVLETARNRLEHAGVDADAMLARVRPNSSVFKNLSS